MYSLREQLMKLERKTCEKGHKLMGPGKSFSPGSFRYKKVYCEVCALEIDGKMCKYTVDNTPLKKRKVDVVYLLTEGSMSLQCGWYFACAKCIEKMEDQLPISSLTPFYRNVHKKWYKRRDVPTNPRPLWWD